MKVMLSEVEDEGLISLMGKTVTIFCMNYIYTGQLVGVNDTCIKLDGAKIVYETGDLKTKTWQNAQELPQGSWYVQTSSIESFGLLK